MNFINYLKRVIDEFKSIGKSDEKSKDAQSELDDYIENYDDQNDTYQKLEADILSDTEIEEAAKYEADDWLKNKQDTLESNYSVKASAEEAKKDTASQRLDTSSASIDKTAEKAKQSAKNSSIKQGVARSSIAEGKQAAVEEARTESLDKAYEKYLADLDKIAESLATLETKKRSAINDLDYEYAALIDSRIAKLKDERQKRVDAVTKYNNQLAEKEQAANAKVDEKKSEDIYLKADGILGKMTAKEASEYIKTNTALKNSLTPYHYYKLYKKYA